MVQELKLKILDRQLDGPEDRSVMYRVLTIHKRISAKYHLI